MESMSSILQRLELLRLASSPYTSKVKQIRCHVCMEDIESSKALLVDSGT